MSWGHDEYMYHVLKHNKSTLPEKALHIIVSQRFSSRRKCQYKKTFFKKKQRYHSFYPWHTSRDYTHFEAPGDEDIMYWVNTFKYASIYAKTQFLLTHFFTKIKKFFLFAVAMICIRKAPMYLKLMNFGHIINLLSINIVLGNWNSK